MNKNKICYFAAGGTGGHINAAKTLGDYFEKLGHEVKYISGKRELDYKLFKSQSVIHIDSSALVNVNIAKVIKSLILNFISFFKLVFLYLKNRPQFIFGTGGYVCGPALLSGFVLKIPIFILEQNSVAGFTNKILTYISKRTFTHFKKTIGITNSDKVIVSGNPIREEIIKKLLENSRKIGEKKSLNILVFGGSLGASSINKMINEFIKLDSDFPLEIKHQTGFLNNNMSILDTELGKNISYEKIEYIDDMAGCYNWCDLVICRSGASTISELRCVQKPCILIPFPQASYNHQEINAKYLAEEANFPVYIENIESLSCKGFKRMIDIFKELQNNINLQPVIDLKTKIISPSEIIYKEIFKDV